MAQDRLLTRLEAKIDALLEKAGIDSADFDTKPAATETRKLTPQEQEAIDNAPKAEASVPPAEAAPRVNAQNAPSTASSVPPMTTSVLPANERKGTPDKSKGKPGTTEKVNWNS